MEHELGLPCYKIQEKSMYRADKTVTMTGFYPSKIDWIVKLDYIVVCA